MFWRFESTDLEIAQKYVRVKLALAVLDTVRSAPTQTVTVRLADAVAPLSLAVNVAVLSCFVHVPAGSPVKAWLYENALGLASPTQAVPRVPPSVSVTLTQPSLTVSVNEILVKVKVAEPATRSAPSCRVCASQPTV